MAGLSGAERHVQPHVNAVFARQFVAETGAARHHRLRAVEPLEIIPDGPAADEAHQAEALPELPAQFGFDLRQLLTLIAHDRHAAQVDERPQIERRVAKARRHLAAQAEKEPGVQRHELHRDESARAGTRRRRPTPR